MMNPSPLNSITSADIRIDMPMIRRAVAEGLQEYKEKNSSACLNIVGFLIGLGLIITILAFIVAISYNVSEIHNKIGA